MICPALKWIGGVDGFLELVDQRRLPVEFVKLHCRDIDQLYDAIKTLAVRGAPAIGVSADFGCRNSPTLTVSRPACHSWTTAVKTLPVPVPQP